MLRDICLLCNLSVVRAKMQYFSILNVAKKNDLFVHVRNFLYLCTNFLYMKEMLIVIGLMLTAMLLLCVRIIMKKDGRFRSQHISENKRMRQDGIHCANSQDREARRKNTNKIDVQNL